ncbi:50S ribosomal protein L11 methyltransferase [Phytoactinopolyspora halophila]|uniref:50S ribosomal protein L11 methyltransferase n=1 Tax=Phytoactinopolyspora halophila TaxID=1981511 RepID=UPI00248307DE|nr:50S ribosomal protein L11 methyltransferase [Phytoactinopolyspora halophila]
MTIDSGVFAPSSTSRVLGDTMQINPGDTVLDAGCGSGVLSFVAARAGASRVIGCDVSQPAIDCANANARRLGLDDITEFRCGSLLEPVSDIRADTVIADISGVPDAVAEATGWFPDGRGGGPTGAELPIAMLADIKNHLTPHGRVYLPTATLQDESKVLRAARRVFGDDMRALASRDFPLPNAISRAKDVARLISDGVIRLNQRGSRLFWRLTVWSCGPA